MTKRVEIEETRLQAMIFGKVCCKCEEPLTITNVNQSRLLNGEHMCKPCRNKASQKENLKAKQRTMNEYGGKCVCCGENELIFLTIDHIYDDGAQERGKSKHGGSTMRGTAFYRQLHKRGYPKDNYQVLCFNCNFAKHVLGQCPHQHPDNKQDEITDAKRNHPNRVKLSIEQEQEIVAKLKSGASQTRLAKEYGVSRVLIKRIAKTGVRTF